MIEKRKTGLVQERRLETVDEGVITPLEEGLRQRLFEVIYSSEEEEA